MLNLANTRVQGTAVSGVGSAISLPDYRVGFDIGVCPEYQLGNRTICITHAHVDHMSAAIQHANIRNMRCVPPTRFIVPPHLEEILHEMFALWERAQGSCEYEIISLDVGQDYRLNKQVIIRPFETYHRIPSQGYGIWRTKQKLKPEYHRLPGQEIGRLRKNGIEVTDTVEFCEVAYTGDTRAVVIDEQEVVRKARLLIMEATFVTDDLSVEFAQERGHTHLAEVSARSDVLDNEAVLLCHFSARHNDEVIVEALANLPEPLRSKAFPLPVGG